VWPALRIATPPTAVAQANGSANPDSARADSLRKAVADSTAYADSVANANAEQANFGEESGISAAPSLLSGPRPDHPFTYSTTYGTLRARRTWDQGADFYFRKNKLAFANKTNITIIEDPDVKRNTRNRSSTFELGYSPSAGLTSGVRASITRNSDIIGIRAANSIIRNTDQLFAFTHMDRRIGGFPLTAGASYGAVNNNQPEFSQRGGQFHGDASSSGVIPGGWHWSAAGDYNSGRYSSLAPTDSGDFHSNDHSTDHSGHGSLSWAPRPWFNFSASGTSKRGQTERPESNTDPFTTQTVVVQERVSTNNDNADVSSFYRAPLGLGITVKGNLVKQDILYAVDSTRTNITKTQGFSIGATDTLLGAPLTFTFQNGTGTNDYTRRVDGYLQSSWTRSMNLTANRRVNARTGADFSSGITLDSRRYTDFIPSTPTSFAPSNQDVLRATGRLRLDYNPLVKFNTSLEGQLDLTRNINLDPTTSASNTDQTGYAVTWRWNFSPFGFWTVSQDNSAGAQVITYPFTPAQDNISYIYQLRTSSVETFSQKLSFETHYTLRYVSRGTYLADATGARAFGKSGGTDSYDLLLRGVYNIATGVSFDISQQTFVTNNFSLPENVKTIDTQTKRHALFVNFTASPKIGTKTVLSFVLRRTLTRDESITYGFSPAHLTTPDDYWQITGSVHTFFDM
jgi:hypothetical protein